MLVYGLVKIFHGQFYTDEYWKDTPLGELSGMQLVWSFYSYSPIYETFLGAIEVVVGLLVLFRRTIGLGIVLFLPVIANLVVINIIYQVGALGSAVPLLLAGMILLSLHFRSLKRCFWDSDERISRRVADLRTILPKATVILVSCGLAAVILYNNKLKFKPDPEIRGAWTFIEDSQIQRIYFEKGRTCVIKDKAGDLHFASYKTEANKLLTVTDDESRLNWRQAPYDIENGSLVITADSGRQVLTPKAVSK